MFFPEAAGCGPRRSGYHHSPTRFSADAKQRGSVVGFVFRLFFGVVDRRPKKKCERTQVEVLGRGRSKPSMIVFKWALVGRDVLEAATALTTQPPSPS